MPNPPSPGQFGGVFGMHNLVNTQPATNTTTTQTTQPTTDPNFSHFGYVPTYGTSPTSGSPGTYTTPNVGGGDPGPRTYNTITGTADPYNMGFLTSGLFSLGKQPGADRTNPILRVNPQGDLATGREGVSQALRDQRFGYFNPNLGGFQ